MICTEVVLPFMSLPTSQRPRTQAKHFNPLTDPLDELDSKLSKHSALIAHVVEKKRSKSFSDWTEGDNLSRWRRLTSSQNLSSETNAPPSSLQRSARERSSKSPLFRSTTASRDSGAGQSTRFILPARQQQKPPSPVGCQRGTSGRDKTIDWEKNPQRHLESLLMERGYEITLYHSKDTAFYNRPTEWQIASYGPALVQAVRTDDCHRLRELLPHLSANPCTAHGESLWHMVCHRGNLELLNVLLEHQNALELCQAVDEYGRTPMHEACWASRAALDLVQVLLDRNPILLFLKDSHNNPPLSYVPAQHWPTWRKFLTQHVDDWFPPSGFTTQYRKAITFVHKPPNFSPIEEIPRVSFQMAAMIASGKDTVILEWPNSGAGSLSDSVDGLSERSLLSSIHDSSSRDVDNGNEMVVQTRRL